MIRQVFRIGPPTSRQLTAPARTLLFTFMVCSLSPGVRAPCTVSGPPHAGHGISGTPTPGRTPSSPARSTLKHGNDAASAANRTTNKSATHCARAHLAFDFHGLLLESLLIRAQRTWLGPPYASRILRRRRSTRHTLSNLHGILRDDNAQSEHLCKILYEVRLPTVNA